MPRMISLAVLAAVVIGGLTAPVAAQSRSSIDTRALEQAVTAPSTNARDVLARAFATEEGKAAIAKVGLNAEAVATRLAVVDDATADRLAERVLVGGRGNIVISTTAIIIILLVLILVTD